MRLFIAVETGGEFKKEILRLQGELKKTRKANYTKEENLHITLAFLGEVKPEKFGDICSVLNETAKDCKSFYAKSTGLGSFNTKENQILYCGIQSPELEALANKLREKLENRGCAFDRKKFIPHITVARKIDIHGLDLKETCKEISFLCDKITLFESVREKGSLKYIPKKISRLK